jgi:hypothetical protein
MIRELVWRMLGEDVVGAGGGGVIGLFLVWGLVVGASVVDAGCGVISLWGWGLGMARLMVLAGWEVIE